MTTLFTILFDGIAYGMLLFVLACGLAVTLGLMNFVNLAHGAFAMAGGYVCAVLMNRSGVPFFAACRSPSSPAPLIGVVLERTLYRHLYARSHLDQVLFTIGLVFMAVAAVDYVMGSTQQFIKLPAALAGPVRPVRRRHRPLPAVHHRDLRPADGRAATGPGAHALRQPAARRGRRSARGARARHQRAAGVRLHLRLRLGLAGLGGALGAEILGLDPNFPLKFMIYFLIVVTVGGTSSITGPFLASLLLGIADVAGKYYVPKLGAFIIYTIMIVILIWRPNGLFGRTAAR